jgi:lipoprotein-anchoring transpeptidase ErfK/SrfK
MNTTSSGNFLKAARRAIESGQKAEAQRYLKLALRDNPTNVTAWLWLAGVTPSPQKARGYVARAEMLQPEHPAIPKAKRWLDKKYPQSEPEPKPIAPKQEERKEKRPFSLPPIILQASMVIIMLIMLGGVGWFTWQQLFQQPTEQQVVAQSFIESPVVAQPDGGQDGIVAETDTSTTLSASVPTATPTPIQIAAKNVSQRSQVRATWTVTPTPSPTPTPTPTIQPTFISPDYNSGVRPFGVSNNERWIDVNLTTQTIIAYEGDTAVFNTLVSSGTWEHPTVTGQFRIWLRYESQTMDGSRLGYDYYLENVPYVMYFYKDYAIHGAYWHNNFGTPMSHGCVNVHPTDAGWLFNWASIGTLVNVHY